MQEPNRISDRLGFLKSLFSGSPKRKPKTDAELLEEILSDIDVMLDFTRLNGLVLPDDLRTKIDRLFGSEDAKTASDGGVLKRNSAS